MGGLTDNPAGLGDKYAAGPREIVYKSLSSFYNLHLHLKKAHKATIKLTCNLCGKAFQKNRELINHLETHQNDPEKSHSTSKSKPKTKRKKAVSSSEPKPKAKRAKRTRKNTNKTEKSTSFTKGKRKGGATLKEQAKKSKIDETTEISLSPSVHSDQFNYVSIDEPSTGMSTGNIISPSPLSPPPALSPQNPNVDDDWGWDTDPRLSQPELRTPLELHPPPVSSSPSVPVLASSPRSPPAADLQENSAFEDYFEPLSPKQEVVDDWDGEDDVSNSATVDNNPISNNVSENPSSFPFLCSKCNLQFRTSDFLQIHQSFHSLLIQVKFRCEVPSCFRYLDDAVEYQSHFTSSHNNNLSRNRRSAKRKCNGRRRNTTIPCKYCSKKSRTKSEATLHETTHSKMLLEDPKKSSAEAVQKPQKINFADENSELEDPAEDPLMLIESFPVSDAHHTGSHLFPCPKCDRKYKWSKSLNHHLATTDATLRPFSCPHCPKNFPVNCFLQQHLLSHTEIRSYLCPVCGKSFKYRSHLSAHIKSHYSDPSGFPCPAPNCSKAFASSELLQKHKRWNHSPQNPGAGTGDGDGLPNLYKCQVCDKLFFNELKFERHSKTAHVPKPPKDSSSLPKFACDLCEMTFALRIRWARHKLQHDSNTDILCTLCGHLFPTPEVPPHLDVHKDISHVRLKDNQAKWDPVICDVCGKSFNSAYRLRKHMDRHSDVPLICDVCEKPCKHETDLKLHKNTHLSEKPLKCKFCPYRYNQPTSIYSHMQHHHTGPAGSGFVESPLTADLERNFPCDADGCSQSFSSVPCLKQHQLYHTGDKVSRCNKCGEKFVTQWDVYIHKQQVHKKRFECEYCKKNFPLKAMLEDHVRYNHTLEEPFVCTAPDCGRKFKARQDMKYHMVVAHTGQYKFECEVCGKKMVTKGNYNAHMRVHTGHRVFRCEEDGCEASFNMASLLKKHPHKEHGMTDLAGAPSRGARSIQPNEQEALELT